MKKTQIPAICYIFGLALLLRLVSLNQSLWLDEATSAQVVRYFSFGDIVTVFTKGDFHPPLYYLLLKCWSYIFGTSEVALRMPSVLLGVLSVFLTYLIGKKVKDTNTGLIAALLLAVSPLHVYYSQEARMYMLATLLATLAVYLLVSALKEKKHILWVMFSLVSALLVFTDYLSGLLLVPLFLYVLLFHRKQIQVFMFSMVPLLGTFLLYSPIFVSQLQNGLAVKTGAAGWWQILGVSNLKTIFLIPTKFLIGRISFQNKILYGLFVGFFASTVLYILRFTLKEKKARIFFFWLLVPVLVSIVIGLFVPVLSYFRLLFCLPALYLLISFGIQKVSEKQFLPLLVVVLIGSMFSTYRYLSRSEFQREDWRGLTSFIVEQSGERTAKTVFVANSQMEAYAYYNPRVQAIPGDTFQANTDIVWLVRYVADVFDPGDQVRTSIEQKGYEKKEEKNFNGVVVWKYERVVQ